MLNNHNYFSVHSMRATAVFRIISPEQSAVLDLAGAVGAEYFNR